MADIDDFIWKVKNGVVKEVEDKVEENDKLVNTSINGRYPLHYAADYGQQEVIEYLLKKGARINEPDKHGITPLLSAIYEGHKECVRILLSKGADKTGKTPSGTSYIDAAETEEIKQLLK